MKNGLEAEQQVKPQTQRSLAARAEIHQLHRRQVVCGFPAGAGCWACLPEGAHWRSRNPVGPALLGLPRSFCFVSCDAAREET